MKNTLLRELAEKTQGPLVSIYLPTHKSSPENKQDPLRFKNLLNKAEEKFEETEGKESKDFFKEAHNLKEDIDFWNNSTEGLAVLIDAERTRIYRLGGRINEKVVVSDHFDILPLMNYYETPNDYYLLDISRDRYSLFSLINGEIKEVETPGVCDKFTDLYDDNDNETNVNFTRNTSNSLHGQKSKPEEDEKDMEKYYRYLDKELGEFFKDSTLPVILFGTTDSVASFSESVDSIPIYEKIEKPFDSIPINEVVDTLREKLLPKYIERINKRIEGLHTEIANDRGTKDLEEIKKEAHTGKIETLFVSIKFEDGDIERIVSSVMAAGGEIVLVDSDQSEFELGIGANYRY